MALSIPFLQARHFKLVGRTRVDLVVLHSAEIGESLEGAEILMRRCAIKRVRADGTEIKNSWHYAVDADSISQSVKDEDIAWHASGANANGIGIELCGRARQTAAEWDDDYSRSTIARAANLTSVLCRRWGIPVAFVAATELRAGMRGITTHAEVSLAFGKSNHTDPGPDFPVSRFLGLVRTYSRASS